MGQSGLRGDSTLATNDYHRLPVSDKQRQFARDIAQRAHIDLPAETLQDRRALSAWIDAHKVRRQPDYSAYPSSRQVAFAERIARLKRREVPQECFRDRVTMSHWIDSNK